jgi:hypothetical protein
MSHVSNHARGQHVGKQHGHKHVHDSESKQCVSTQDLRFGDAGLKVKGDKIDTGKYEVVVSKDEVLVKDKESGKWFRVWGDPHVSTSDGDKLGFTDDNLTVDLPDGTKLTLVPTEPDANGVSFLDKAYVMKGEQGVEVTNIHSDGGPKLGKVTDDAIGLDEQADDGTVLRIGAELDDLVASATGKEFIGGDETARFGEFDLDGLGGESGIELGDLQGGDIYARLFAILSRLEAKLKSKVNELDKLSKDPNMNKAGMEKLQFEIQQITQLMQQVSAMASNISKNDHEAKMNTIRNTRA